MPTILPFPTSNLRKTHPSYFVIFLAALAISFFVIQIVDPAPMDVEAALGDAAAP